MTDAELRDAAVAHLKQTTTGYLKSNGQPKPPPWPENSAHWKPALDLLAQIGQQPSGNKLMWAPPLLNNPTTLQLPPSRALALDDSKDYIVNIGHVQWSSGSGRTFIHIKGGRNVVIIGGRVSFDQTNAQDDQTAFLIDDGDPAGTVHIEGVLIDSSVNGFTLRTKRMVQIENVHSRVSTRGFPGPHPDLVQIWDRGPCKVRMHRFTGWSDYTGLSCLLTPNPASWELYDVDIHSEVYPDGSRPMSAVVYHNSGNTPESGPFTNWTGRNLWCDTGNHSGGKRKLDDVLILKYLDPIRCWPYELTGHDGQRYVSPLAPTGGNAPYPLGARQGDSLTFERVPEFDVVWTQGVPPENEFVPPGVAGVNYVSPGYQN